MMAAVLPLRIRAREHRGAVLVHPVGVLDVSTYAQLRDTLIKYAIEEPAAVIVDMSELAVPSAYSLAVFSAVSTQVEEWPGVPLLLLSPDGAQRARLLASPVGRFVPVVPDLDVAMHAIGSTPQRRRSRLRLPATPDCSALARQFVHQLCSRWDIPAAAEDAAAIATELVENVVQHTFSAPDLRLELRADMLSVAVSDQDRHPAVLREAVSHAAPSAGLAIVTALARTWGSTPTPNGKIVWAVLPLG
ncbi:MAG TPA: STAS domain-containing protein [Pseudonocardiaceae bacterium]|jgi:anti-anti-sigma regulatory factor